MTIKDCGADMGSIWIPIRNGSLVALPLKCNRPGTAHFADECEYFDERSGMAIRHTGIPGKLTVSERGCVSINDDDS